jgi:hypothetical protein
MNDTKNARPTVGAAGQAAETGTTGKAASNSITYDTTGKGPISRLLSHGQENAVPLRDLVSMTGADGRTVRALIQAERRPEHRFCRTIPTAIFYPQMMKSGGGLSAA